jgi:L-alanine-DL-glutamate epimerase-like enolase superfamily enzyme
MAGVTRVERISVQAYDIPTETDRESDATHEWTSTTCVVVQVHSDGVRGLGCTYAHGAAVGLIDQCLANVVRGSDAMAPTAAWQGMLDAVRNSGRGGLAARAISACDIALWDLKARLLGLPLRQLWGAVRQNIPAYASGGFTSYGERELVDRMGAWASQGFRMIKMKVGRHPDQDVSRVGAVRAAIGPDVQLFVDANGGYNRKQALHFAHAFAEFGVSWLEEPVTSDDLEGQRLLRDRAPPGMQITSGEHGDHPSYHRRMLEHGAVDVLMADATRCLGYTGFAKVAALCEAWHVPLSTHTAPAFHVPLALTLQPVMHLEHFHDHARLEPMLFDGVPAVRDGHVSDAPDAPGHGLSLRQGAAERYAT